MKSQAKIPDIPKTTMIAHKGPVFVVKFNRDGNYLMSGSQDRTIILWNPMKPTPIKIYSKSHNYEIFDICIAPDNGRFVSVGGDKMVFVWDVTTGKTIRKFEGHTSRINTCAWNSDCSILASGSYDTTLRLWDCKSGSNHCVEEIKGFRDSVSKVVIKDYQIIASSIDGSIRSFDVRMGEITIDEFLQPIANFSLSHDSKCYALSSLDSKIRLMERNSGEVLSEYTGHKSESYTVECKFLWDDGFLIAGSEDSYIYIYNVLEGKPVRKLKKHQRVVSAIDVSPRRNGFVSGSFDNSITFWVNEDFTSYGI